MESSKDTFESETNSPKAGDPVATRTGWGPIVKGGANFRTHKLKKIGFHTYKSVPTTGYYFFLGLFFFIGFGALAGAVLGLRDNPFPMFILIMMGSIFVLVAGILTFKMVKLFTLDLDMGVFYKGRSYDPYSLDEEKNAGSIRDIYALQLISERIQGSESSYNSYELNLVLKDGHRVNIMDHGNLAKIQSDAMLISEALDVPIWDSAKWEKGNAHPLGGGISIHS